MLKILRVIGIITLFFLLILVRHFSVKLFYDPFTIYFKNDYLYKAIPNFDALKLFANLFYRYLLNTIISLSILYLAFKNKKWLIFSVQFYLISFIVLSALYYLLLQNPKGYIAIFYIRRFLIHPVFVLLLLPAFYYQKKSIN